MTTPTTFFGWIGFLISKYYPLIWLGIRNTLATSVTGTVVGFVIGLLVGVLRSIPVYPNDSKLKKISVRVLNFIMAAYIEIIRGTPMMVQASLLYYGFLSRRMSALTAGFIVISINTGAYMAEIVRGGIMSIDRGQTEGAQSVGMTHWQTMVNVILPQAIRNIMPAVGNEFVINIKDSSVLSVISVAELFFQGRGIAGTYLRYRETYIIIAAVYFILTFTTTRLLRIVERKMDGPKSYVMGKNDKAATKQRARGSQ